jgi:DNA-binding CsgD family transcriptional regulator
MTSSSASRDADPDALAAELVELRQMRDPARQVAAATSLLSRLALVEYEVSGIRDEAIRRLRADGQTYAEIAEVSGLTRARVAQLLRRAEQPGSVGAAPPQRSASVDPAAP